jgi:Domain of unknown function (DUF4126)
MDHGIVETLAITLGAGWASGLNLYATVLTLGMMNALGYASLPEGLQPLSSPLVLGAASLMYIIEFFVDKVPGVDSAWDGLHTFIRIPAGAMLAAGAASGFHLNEAAGFAAALLGGSLSAESHFIKSGSRVLINTSPEPFSNWAASFTEDFAAIGGLWTALQHPWAFLALLLVAVLLMAWLLPKLWHTLRGLFRRIGRLFGSRKDAPP